MIVLLAVLLKLNTFIALMQCFLRGETYNFVSSHIDAVFTFLLAQTFDHFMNICGTLKLPFIHYPESPEENKKVEKPSNLFPRWKPFGAGIIMYDDYL